MLAGVQARFGVGASAARELRADLLSAAQAGSAGFVSYGKQSGAQALGEGSNGPAATLGKFALRGFSTGVDERLAQLTDGHRFAAQFPPPTDIQAQRLALRRDLKEVPVQGPGGRVIDVHQKIMADKTLSSEQKDRIMSVLAEVHGSLYRIDDAIEPGGKNKGYQVVNWKHTRGEIDQVLEASKLEGLTAAQTEDALLASIFSDAVKIPENFITHNVDGAKAAPDVLSRYFDPHKPEDMGRIEGIVQVIKEHQIGPPQFMSMMLGMFIKKGGPELSKAEESALASLTGKVADPFSAPRAEDGTGIAFSDQEKALMARAGVDEWTVPQPESPHYGASRAVIVGDSLINYASPDGWAKLVAIRGPGTFFKDETVFDSLASAKQSYDDAQAVITDEAKPLAEAGLQRTERAVERVRAKMEPWIEQQVRQGKFEKTDDGKVPFWDAALAHPDGDPSTLSPTDQKRFNFAIELRAQMVELLRAEQGTY
jgi:hypothetical protein